MLLFDESRWQTRVVGSTISRLAAETGAGRRRVEVRNRSAREACPLNFNLSFLQVGVITIMAYLV
jgi:hypothetical protein